MTQTLHLVDILINCIDFLLNCNTIENEDVSKLKRFAEELFLRVISGSARGKKLCTIEGRDIRPTLDRVKESIFNMIAFDLPGATVLDLFCGSGALGIEALSRGAKHATFVDNNAASLTITKKNLAETHLSDRAFSVLSDSLHFLETTTEQFDIIFIDPPYDSDLYERALEVIKKNNILADDGIIILEHPIDKSIKYEGFELVKAKSYGNKQISFLVS